MGRLRFLFVRAFIADAASVVLPIESPANRVVTPPACPRARWLAAFALPSLAIAATCAARRRTQARAEGPDGGRSAGLVAGLGILAAGGVLIAASAPGSTTSIFVVAG